MTPPRPFLLVSAAPNQPTGASRLATDLGHRLWAAREALGIDLLHVGSLGATKLPWAGLPLNLGVPWPVWAYPETAVDGAKQAVDAAAGWKWGRAAETAKGVLLVVEEPSRVYNALMGHVVSNNFNTWARWGYLYIDGANAKGTIGGAAGHAVRFLDRVLACAPYGARILQTLRSDRVEWIPPGYNPEVFQPLLTPEEATHAQRLLDPTGQGHMVLGCVATNQTRKDWGLFCAALAELRHRGVRIGGWAHIDQEMGEAWSLPELAAIHGLDWKALTVTTKLTDRELAICYSRCIATVAIGRGEGFGYPIVESHACGTPCVHVDYAAGADLTPWTVPYARLHAVGPYALLRPIVDPEAVADEVQTIIARTQAARDLAVQTAAQYRWNDHWPRLQAWLATGLGVRDAEDDGDKVGPGTDHLGQ